MFCDTNFDLFLHLLKHVAARRLVGHLVLLHHLGCGGGAKERRGAEGEEPERRHRFGLRVVATAVVVDVACRCNDSAVEERMNLTEYFEARNISKL